MQTVLTTDSQTSKGFTLIELMIAIAIFAVMSVMAYGGLSQIIDNSTHSQAELERLKSVQRAVLTISRDLRQITQRGIRDEFGNPQPFLIADSTLDYLIEFTRSGRRNPAKLQRSNLLRVAYEFKDEKLIRVFWPQLDRAPGTEFYQTTLLEKVTQVELKYRDELKKWHTEWPPISAGNAAAPPQLTAIELILELSDWGKISRLYQVGS